MCEREEQDLEECLKSAHFLLVNPLVLMRNCLPFTILSVIQYFTGSWNEIDNED